MFYIHFSCTICNRDSDIAEIRDVSPVTKEYVVGCRHCGFSITYTITGDAFDRIPYARVEGHWPEGLRT